MNNLIELSGQFFSEGKQVPFHVEIRMPEQDGPDYLCRILSPQLFTRCMNVHGASWNQAVRLAVSYVQIALISRVIKEDEVADDPGEQHP